MPRQRTLRFEESIKLKGNIKKDELKLHCSSLHLEDAPCEQGTCHVTTKLS